LSSFAAGGGSAFAFAFLSVIPSAARNLLLLLAGYLIHDDGFIIGMGGVHAATSANGATLYQLGA
jgi:hypothetical protein